MMSILPSTKQSVRVDVACTVYKDCIVTAITLPTHTTTWVRLTVGAPPLNIVQQVSQAMRGDSF